MSRSAASTSSQSASPEAIWPNLFCLRVNNFQRMNEIGVFSINFILYASFFLFQLFHSIPEVILIFERKIGPKKQIILNKKCVNQFIEFIYYRPKWLWHNVWQNVCLSFFEEHGFIGLHIFQPTGIFPALTSSLWGGGGTNRALFCVSRKMWRAADGRVARPKPSSYIYLSKRGRYPELTPSSRRPDSPWGPACCTEIKSLSNVL